MKINEFGILHEGDNSVILDCNDSAVPPFKINLSSGEEVVYQLNKE
mgnify:CR=1 FL=1